MHRKMMTVAVAGVLVGVLAGLLAGASLRAAVAIPVFKGKEPNDAAEALLAAGLEAAGKGSWERIAVGAVFYEGADKSRGQAIIDEVLNGKPEFTDFQRAARLYAELGEWDKAKGLYDKAIALKGSKASLLAEAGAWYNLNGDRAKAEELFTKAFAADSGDTWSYSMTAASYLGKKPRPW
jgi:tetratricopeptide (TPR) repeat protein